MLRQWVHTWHVRRKSLEDKIRQLISGSVGDAKLGYLLRSILTWILPPSVIFLISHKSVRLFFPKNSTLQVGDTIVIREGYETRQDFHTLWLQGLSSYLSQPQRCLQGEGEKGKIESNF